MAKSRGRFFKRPLLFAEEDSPVLERPEQIMVDLVVFLRKNIKATPHNLQAAFL